MIACVVYGGYKCLDPVAWTDAIVLAMLHGWLNATNITVHAVMCDFLKGRLFALVMGAIYCQWLLCL